jgi:cytochrome c
MKKRALSVLTILTVILFAFPAIAGTRDDCITKCKQAAALFKQKGMDAAVKEIGNKNGQFVWNDGISYVFMMDMNAHMIAHPFKPELANVETLIDKPDANGKLFRKEFIKKASNGKGWTKYVYEVPGKDVVKPKHTFIYRIPETDYFVGSGFYVMKAGVYY